MEALLDAGLQAFRMYWFFYVKQMEALLDAGLRGPPTLQNVLVVPCETDGSPT